MKDLYVLSKTERVTGNGGMRAHLILKKSIISVMMRNILRSCEINIAASLP